jgi:hypothetical protein
VGVTGCEAEKMGKKSATVENIIKTAIAIAKARCHVRFI